MAISGVSNTTAAPPASANNASGGVAINQQQFLQLLTAQLKAQDPLNPISATDFTSQLAQLSTLSGMQQLNLTTSQLLQLQQFGQGAALLGKTVTYLQPGSTSNSSGVVQGISVQNGQVQVQVGNQQIALAQINGIST